MTSKLRLNSTEGQKLYKGSTDPPKAPMVVAGERRSLGYAALKFLQKVQPPIKIRWLVEGSTRV